MLSLSSAVELSKLDLIESVTALKAEVDALRPLPPETEQRIMQKLRLDWNYHSNSIEGNQLSYGETVAFLMHGLTAKGKPLKDHLDIRGHNEAIRFLTSLVKDERGISEADIRALHKLILVEPYEVDALTPEGNPTKKWIRLGEYKRESNSVKTRTGETHFYATPEETPARMRELMDWLNEAKATPGLHPLVTAVLFHHEFTAIHPFDDGNGRMARLLSNLSLMQSGYPPVVVKQDNRDDYYSVLSQADAGSFVPVVMYFLGLLERSLDVYLRGAKGENIEEADDLAKEIVLFKTSLEVENNFSSKRRSESILTIFEKSLIPLIIEFKSKIIQFNDLFLQNSETLSGISGPNDGGTIISTEFDDFSEWKDKLSWDFEEILYEYKLENYKNDKHSFKLNTGLSIGFNSIGYKINFVWLTNLGTIIIGEAMTVDKMYSQIMSSKEIYEIVKNYIRILMKNISESVSNK